MNHREMSHKAHKGLKRLIMWRHLKWLKRQEVIKVALYLSVNVLSAVPDMAQAGMTRLMQVREGKTPYGEDG